MIRLGLVAITVTLVAAASFAPQARAASASDFVAKWDPDHDRTLDMAEISKAADMEFDKLDVDHDGTLDKKELGNRVTKSDFSAIDADHDGTLDKAEFEALVGKRFKLANHDSDATIDVAEFKTAAGRHLLQLLQ